MRIRVLFGLAIFVVAGAASCPQTKANSESCLSACNNLAKLLRQEREQQNHTSPPGLDIDKAEGQANLRDCAERCEQNANEPHVICLEQASSLKAWMACDDGSNDWP